MAQWNQGLYRPNNVKKCLNTSYPKYRSNFERQFMLYLDNNSNVIRWGSEIINIKYINSLDGKEHKYITDFYFEALDSSGKIIKYLIEVKPSSESPILNEFNDLIPPPPPKKKSTKSMNNYIAKLRVLEKNKCKWLAAKEYCRTNNIIFKIITEKDLF